MDFEFNQEEIKFRINHELSKFFTVILSEFPQSSLEYQFVSVLQEYTMRGGKRSRPALLYNFYLFKQCRKPFSFPLRMPKKS